MHDRIQQFFNVLYELIKKLLEQGIQAGEFRAGISSSECAYLFVSALEGSLILAETLNDISIVRTTSDRFFKLLV